MDILAANPEKNDVKSGPLISKADIAQAFAGQMGAKSFNDLNTPQISFFNQFIEDYQSDELPDLSFGLIAQIMVEAWDWGEVRAAGSATLKRIRPLIDKQGKAYPYDIVEVVQSDAPFIVESIIGELVDQGLTIVSLFHPIVEVTRNPDGQRAAKGNLAKESMVLVIIERVESDRQAAILNALNDTLNDLRLAVIDYPRMVRLLEEEIVALDHKLSASNLSIMPAELVEDIEFLRWIGQNHFVFLGAKSYVYPRDGAGDYAPEAPLGQLQQGFGILRDQSRPVLRRASEPAVLSQQLLNQIESGQAVTVAKANLKSRVHRRVYLDYIGIKRFGEDGKPDGEIRFVGLFTSEAYDKPVFDVPMIRKKAQNVLDAALGQAYNHGGYNEKRLKNIIETYPRDELFQMTSDDLLRISRGIMRLSDRPRVKIFTRTDPFDRFISVLLYIPKELYQVTLQSRAGDVLASAYGGRVSACYPNVTEQALTCIHYIIGVTPGDHLDPLIMDIEAEITGLTRGWPQKIAALGALQGRGRAASIDWLQWAKAFPVGYQERYASEESLLDIEALAALSAHSPLGVRAYQRPDDQAMSFCFKLYSLSEKALPLSDILPILDNIGLKTLEEYGHNVRSTAIGQYWLFEFIMALPQGPQIAFDSLKSPFESALLAVLAGKAENDGFNGLVLNGLAWRDIGLLRALCNYRQQSGLDPSSSAQQKALCEYPHVTKALLDLFSLKFDLKPVKVSLRKSSVEQAVALIIDALRGVTSLEQDRILRRILALIGAITRTNFYQTQVGGGPKPYISFKVASRELVDLPEPKPYREIYVSAPNVEGVHLRFGPVARGGLRWSDRREDFRTEVLGLVKAQQVKNAVIVPVGSKGGFFPKSLLKNTAPDLIRAHAIEAYKTFLCGLLDLTDNYDAKGEVVAPKDTVIWDQPDPYLVVAADKGTATFSDIANSVSKDYGFWLGDAFASGGSVGYDHKAMAITARGAWEAIKRHFRERGKDIQSQVFTVAGVGDMSGDVFGNGMLLSPCTKLLAAFDHRDIFLDPNPDALISLKERERLFKLPRSSWADYDQSLISQGGGVFSRSLKSIDLSLEVRTALGISDTAMTPDDLMRAILCAPVELLYFGGIGTYIKSPSESHLQVGDKANDTVRINANQVKAAVIGEGANLGLTQAGRIACAMAGVRLNTDAIDNSAGVDCSDHEVNIKILLGQCLANQTLDLSARDKLLAAMTDEVANHVLAHNYDQTLALSLQQDSASDDNWATQSYLSDLEKRGRLDRKVEGLPENSELEARRLKGLGLFRPELAVVMAYAKLVLFDDLVASSAPDDAGFQDRLLAYFPKPLHEFKAALSSHRLKREIIATMVGNEIVNLAGPSFAARLQKCAGVDTASMAKAFEAANGLFGIKSLWSEIGALDNQIPDAAQKILYEEVRHFLRRQVYWLARQKSKPSLIELIKTYEMGVRSLIDNMAELLSDSEKIRYLERVSGFVALGAPQGLAQRIGLLNASGSATDIVDLSQELSLSLDWVTRFYFLIGERFALDHLRLRARENYSLDEWDRLATRRLIEDLSAEQKNITRASILQADKSLTPQDNLKLWYGGLAKVLAPWDKLIEDIEQGTGSKSGSVWSFAKLTIVNATLREITIKL
jgi:glutamate dehydrogenase